MTFFNAFNLLAMAADHGIIRREANMVFVYRQAGSPPEQYPEGWYEEKITDIAQELMDDEKGQQILVEQLRKKGIEFKLVPELSSDN